VPGKLLHDGLGPGKHHPAVPDHLAGEVQGLGAVLLDDVLVWLPCEAAALAGVEVVEVDPLAVAAGEVAGGGPGLQPLSEKMTFCVSIT
jgi:hypothetical protein